MWDAKRSWDKWGWQKEFYETEGKKTMELARFFPGTERIGGET